VSDLRAAVRGRRARRRSRIVVAAVDGRGGRAIFHAKARRCPVDEDADDSCSSGCGQGRRPDRQAVPVEHRCRRVGADHQTAARRGRPHVGHSLLVEARRRPAMSERIMACVVESALGDLSVARPAIDLGIHARRDERARPVRQSGGPSRSTCFSGAARTGSWRADGELVVRGSRRPEDADDDRRAGRDPACSLRSDACSVEKERAPVSGLSHSSV